MAFGIAAVSDLFRSVEKKMQENRDLIIELDSRLGDGDLGLTMTGAFAAAAALSPGDEKDIGKYLAKAGLAMNNAAPSTMGTLMASGFMRGGKALRGVEEIFLDGLRSFFHAFLEGLMERGKSVRGEKTIIDVIGPVSDSFDIEYPDMATALNAALEAAEAGPDATKDMLACRGRAAYYQEQSLGHQAPGATAGLFLVQGFAEVFG
jgi:phosphoenolpyruvate---glycerone phosphotransferase subunit DhaL